MAIARLSPDRAARYQRAMSENASLPLANRVALVVGGGTMGVGIIAMFIGGGWTVDVVSRSASTRDGLAAAVDELSIRADPKRVVEQGKRRALAIWENPKVKYPVIGAGALIVVLLIRKLLR